MNLNNDEFMRISTHYWWRVEVRELKSIICQVQTCKIVHIYVTLWVFLLILSRCGYKGDLRWSRPETTSPGQGPPCIHMCTYGRATCINTGEFANFSAPLICQWGSQHFWSLLLSCTPASEDRPLLPHFFLDIVWWGSQRRRERVCAGGKNFLLLPMFSSWSLVN